MYAPVEIVNWQFMPTTDYPRNLNSNKIHNRRQTAREEKTAGPKMRALQETVLRMNEKNVRLQQENKTLKEDLEKIMDESAQSKARSGGYMSHVHELEKWKSSTFSK